MPLVASAFDHRPSVGQRWPMAVLTRAAAHSLAFLNALNLSLVVGAIGAPMLLAAGATGTSSVLYRLFHLVCHQWAFRSFFVLGPQATWSHDQLEAFGVDPYTFVGDAETGWKVAFCERNLAIVLGLLAFGLVYAAARRHLRAASFPEFAVLIGPMALDGLTQFVGWRESTWELRVATGLLFGIASGWFLYPRCTGEPRRAAPLG